MNSNPRGVQTPPRPQPQRQAPTRQPVRQPQHPLASVSTGFWVVFSATLLLLAAMIIALTVTLCIADEPKGANGPSGGGQTQSDNNNPTNDDTPAVAQKTKPLPTSPTRSQYCSSGNGVSIANITSEAAILVDLSTYQAVASKAPDTKIHPASMTKVMTALVALEELAKEGNDLYLEELLLVKQEQITYQEEMYASGAKFEAGWQIRMKDALYLMVCDSNFVATQVVVERIAGSEENFVSLMNKKAGDMHLTNPHFNTATGNTSNRKGQEVVFDHYTTCREMAAIMAAALDNPLLKTMLCSSQSGTIQLYKNNKPIADKTWNLTSGWNKSDRFGSKVTLDTVTVKGGKTGGEVISQACLVSYALGTDGKAYICVQVGRIDKSTNTKVDSGQSTTDTKAIYNTYVKD